MTLETLVAIIALLCAVYAVIPRARRLEIRFRLHATDWLLIVILLIAVHVMLFYPLLQEIRLVPKWPFSPLTPAQSAYFLVLIVGLLLFIRVSRARLLRRQIFALQSLVEELIQSNNFAELLALLEKNLRQISKIQRQDFHLLRIKRHLIKVRTKPDDLNWEDVIARYRVGQSTEGIQERPKRQHLRKLIQSVLWVFVRFVPEHSEHATAAQWLMRRVMLSGKVVTAIAANRPYFALSLLDLELYEKHDFLDLYFRSLLSDQHSILYFELGSNRNVGVDHNYYVPESNRLLFYLFSKAKRAEELAVWRPVGEYLIWYLDQLVGQPETDPYNRPIGDFEERGKWGSPLFAGIFFFDIMVSSSLRQGVTWHMWLYYFTHFVDRIVRNLRPIQDLVDPLLEWPTPYHYLLYKIFETLTDWIEASRAIPKDQENVTIHESPGSHENGNIPKSAVFALTDCIRKIALADRMSPRFKKYLMDIVLGTYFNLRENENTEAFASVLRFRLSERSYDTQEDRERFRTFLLECLDGHDKLHYKREHIEELQQALR